MRPRSAPTPLLAALLGVVACNATAGDGETDGGGSSTTSTGGTSVTDGGSTNEAGTGDIHGPVGEWVWHDVPGAICANGTPTGLGVNQGTGDRLVIYMSGGSACLDEG